MTQRGREILPLTGVRALAAWWVVAFHFARSEIASPLAHRFVAAGHVAVDLFFVLSGFVLAHRYGPAELAAPGGHRRFWMHRLARVYPLYLASLALGFAAEWPRSWRDLATGAGEARLGLQLTLLNAWSHRAMFRLNWAAWSLSVEAFFYLVFPWILPRVARLARAKLVALIVLCSVAALVAPAIYETLDPDRLGRPLALSDEVFWSWYLKFFPVQRLPAFVAGVAAGCLVAQSDARAWTSTRAAIAPIAAIVAVVGAGIVPYAYLQAGALLPLFVLLVAALARGGGAVERALASAPVVALGRASYATYILHVPLFLGLARLDPLLWKSLLHVLVYAAVLVVASLAAHRGVEEPLRKAIVKWGARDGGAAAESPPAPTPGQSLA